MTTAKIAALSKCDDTGITPGLAQHLWPKLGHSLVAVVELLVDEHSEDSEGDKGIKLVINSIEPATERITERHLREIQRALYMSRNPQPQLGDPDEASVRQIVENWADGVQAMVDDPDSGIDSVTISTGDKSATVARSEP